MSVKKYVYATLTALLLMCGAAWAARIGAFETRDLNGAGWNQELLKNAKVTVFNVWGTFCPPCLRELPDLGELAREMKADGVQVIGLLSDWRDRRGNEDPAKLSKARTIVRQTRADYPHLLLTPEMRRQLGGFNFIPQTYIVLRSGHIVRQHSGATGKSAFREMIAPILQKVR